MSDRNDIVYVIPRPEIGGAEKQLLRLIEHMDSSRFRATVICLDGGGSLLDEYEAIADEVVVLRRRGLFDVITFARLLGHIRRIRPTTVHTTLYIANLFGGWAAKLAGVPRIVVSQRGLGIDPQHSKIKRALHALFNSLIGQLADVRLANSQAVADKMASYGWTRTQVIHNGILDRPKASCEKLSELRKELGITDGQVVLTAVSRIDPKKDLLTMLRAFRLVETQHPQSCLLVAGDGFPRYLEDLKNEASRLNIASKVRFLGFRNDIPDLLAITDISLLSSITEGLPNAILESMLQATPVVSTAVGGVPELVDHGVEGYLVAPGDHEGFARRVTELIENPVRRGSMGIFGRTKALSEFGIQNTVEKTTALYYAPNSKQEPDPSVQRSEKQHSGAVWKSITSKKWAKSA